MRLLIHTTSAAAMPGKRVLALFNEDGECLPGQCGVEIVQDEEGHNHVTVSFEINGVDVILDGSFIGDD